MTAAGALDSAQLEAVAAEGSRIGELLAGPGCVVIRGGVNVSVLAALRMGIEAQYEALEAAVRAVGIHQAAHALQAGVRYQASAAALGLDSFEGWEAAARALNGGVVAAVAAWFDGRPAVVRDLTWVRRQYPPALRAAGHAPHTLHQDGAFGFPFSDGAGGGPHDVLDMLTAWIPLCPAGFDAPGLEFRSESPHRLLGLAELASRSAFDDRVCPVFEPGDVVLMAGHHVHRTHVTQEMTRPRTCIELRFVAARDANERLPGPRIPLAQLRS